MHFLTKLQLEGSSFSAVNTAKSALATFVTINNSVNWTNHPTLIKFMKGVFKINPPKPKYNITWDVNKVIVFISKNFENNQKLSLKELTLKTVMLVTLISGQRAQSISELDLELCHKNETRYIFHYNSNLKTSKPGNYNFSIEVNKFTQPVICPYLCWHAGNRLNHI